jgi:cytochrome P450
MTSALTTVRRRMKYLPGLALRHPPSARLAPTAPYAVPWIGPLFGHLPAPGAAKLDGLMKAALSEGDVVRFEFPHITGHLVAHPDHVQQVLVDQHRLFTKQTRGYEKLRAFLGNGLVTSDGDFWLRQRRIAQPAFHKKRIAGFATTMVEAAEDVVRRWERPAREGTPIDVAEEMSRVTLRIAGETLLSTDPSDKANAVTAALTTVLHEANERINSPFALPDHWPTPRNRRYREAAQELDRIVLDIIERRRRGNESRDDLLQMLLEARDPDTGAGMDDRQLRDEVMTMFLAGHETTANAMAWTLVLLSRFPSVARALHEEACEVLGDRAATAEDLPRLDLARRVLQESMRLYPPVWIVGRSPSQDVSIGGYDIPRGSLVFVSQWVTHRHPRFWDDPEGFDPDRWLPERAKGLHRHQYFPFAAGPRMCIGAGFAMMEGQLLLATIARRYRVDLVPGHPIVPEPLITLRPKHGVQATVHRIG